ncbi:hypothetical protein [Ochrobactrum sp. BTU1]|uniref:hypothetical protein n=1 Tax=Ochrobactrum sp. BTU1 TaxID=2840456 RepID=UPI001C044CD1|nr:hypothetical protein KMS41_11740 [Ochrobactrum sp. BTU1]
MKVLILTNHLVHFGGSEIVALETAIEFRRAGCEVLIAAGYIGEPMQSHVNQTGLPFVLVDDCPSPCEFEFIWSQHQLLSYLIFKHGVESIQKCYIASICLSAYHPLEVPAAIANASDILLANSPETAARLRELGITKRLIRVFYNAAPDEFMQSRVRPKDLRRMLIISNHVPSEVLDAAELLKNMGFQVDHIGEPEYAQRLTPNVLGRYDAVITIGKSVQYSLFSEVPIYVYDRFGGPGWLSLENFQEAEYFNFSGRCCRRKLSAPQIADEIIRGYFSAASAILQLKQENAEKYMLGKLVSELLALSAKKGQRKLDNELISLLKREGALNGELINHLRLTYQQSRLILQNECNLSRLEEQSLTRQKQIENLENIVSRLTEKLENLEADNAVLHQNREIDYRICSEISQELIEARLAVELMRKSSSWRLTKPLRALRKTLSRLLPI